ncbi:hypothetical protein [Puia sp.]|uniref:hypothetical protein n=1 Tax=Puia sp. TaxID=2045100 RepID=UPI002F411658
MQLIRSTVFFCLAAFSLTGCSGLASRLSPQQNAAQGASSATQGASDAGQSSQQNAAQNANPNSAAAVSQLIDTTKLKGDMNSLLNSIASGKPDTNALKMTAKDVLNTTNQMLSDSGIDKLYGNSNDPSVKAAAEMLKKYRNGMGITPAMLDSIKQAAGTLNNH